jgi:Ser/Thr protein kinase RdoA (MazF antagonist)
MNQSNSSTPYYKLDPDTVIDAIESTGLQCDGRLLALNSYENRVYQVGLEEATPVHEGFRFSLFERRGGHAPELDQKETRQWVGRFMGRMHAVGACRSFEHRPALTPERFGRESIETILKDNLLPAHLETAFSTLAEDLMSAIDAAYARTGAVSNIRLHGDCHPGNILWRDGPFFVDMDDCQSGPAIQDLWMLLSGDNEEMGAQLKDVLDGYREFHHFNMIELNLVESLRTLRMLHHSAWLARRWEDPAFPIAFPWFGEPRYWEDMVLSLREQLSRLQELPLELPYAY